LPLLAYVNNSRDPDGGDRVPRVLGIFGCLLPVLGRLVRDGLDGGTKKMAFQSVSYRVFVPPHVAAVPSVSGRGAGRWDCGCIPGYGAMFRAWRRRLKIRSEIFRLRWRLWCRFSIATYFFCRRCFRWRRLGNWDKWKHGLTCPTAGVPDRRKRGLDFAADGGGDAEQQFHC